MGLSEFLTARLAEDEAWAEEALAYGPDAPDLKARVLREVEAKRAILAAYVAMLPVTPDEPEWHIARRTAFEHACNLLALAYDPAWKA